MTKVDYLREIENLSSENEKIATLRKYYDQYSAEKNIPQQIILAEILAEKFDNFGFKIQLPHLYYEIGEYDKVIKFLDDWYDAIKNNYHSRAIVLPNTMLWQVLSYKKLNMYDKALRTAEFQYEFAKQVLNNYKNNVGENGDFRTWETPVTLALAEIGEIYFEKGDYYKAKDYFFETLNYPPSYKSGYYLGYFCFYGIGGAEKDLENAQQCLNFVTSESAEYYLCNCSSNDIASVSKACYLLGEIYATEKKCLNAEKARQAYQKARTLGYNITESEIQQKVANINNVSAPSKDSKSGCYVATCVYGSYDCPQVWTLRRFRDTVLKANVFGRGFIRFYYAIGPVIVKWFGQFFWFHKLFKKPLDKFVAYLVQNGMKDTPYQD